MRRSAPLRPRRVLALTLGVAGALAAAPHAWAQDAGSEPEFPLHRWQVGARLGFNLSVDFQSHGPALPSTWGTPGLPLQERIYADGFVRPDASGSPDGDTWNWGYESAGQVASDGSALRLHGYSGSPYADAADRSEDPQWGAEIRYLLTLREWAGATWGFDVGFNWTSVGIEDDSALTGSITETTDSYALAGLIVPGAPYSGSSAGPGPILAAASPTRTTAQVPTLITGTRELEGNLFGFQIGPRIDIPLGDWLSAQLGGGVAVGCLDGEIRYRETASVASGTSWSRSGESSDAEWMIGGYLRGQLSVRLSDRTGLYAAAEYLGLTSATLGDANQEAHVSLGSGVALSAGIQFGF